MTKPERKALAATVTTGVLVGLGFIFPDAGLIVIMGLLGLILAGMVFVIFLGFFDSRPPSRGDWS